MERDVQLMYSWYTVCIPNSAKQQVQTMSYGCINGQALSHKLVGMASWLAQWDALPWESAVEWLPVTSAIVDLQTYRHALREHKM